MLKIKKMRWKNILQYGNIWTELDLDSLNYPVGIVGGNGVGKSTMCTVLTYGLFGKPYIKVNKGMIINSVNNKDLLVEIEFESHGKWYKIERGQKPGVLNIYDESGIFDQESSNKNIQTRIEKDILGMNFDTFVQVSILSATNFISFMRMSAGQRRSVIEDILGLGIFSNMNLLLKTRTKTRKDSVETIERALQGEKSKKEFMENMIASTQDATIRQKKSSLKKEIERVKEQFSLLEEYKDIPEKLSYPTEEKDKLVYYRTRIISGTATINDRLKFFNSNTVCPTCEQELSEETRSNQIEINEGKIVGLEKALKEIEQSELRLKERYDIITKTNEDIDKKIAEKKKIQMSIQYSRDIIESLTEDLKKTETPQTINTLLEIEKDIEKLQIEFDEQSYQLKVKQSALKLLEDGGCKSLIIENYLPLMNELLAKYLDLFDFSIRFEFDKDFNEIIRSRFIDEFSYHNFSAGQKMRIDLAILFMFRDVAKLRNSTACNLLILDELLESSLDSEGLRVVRAALFKMSKEGERVVVISHNPDIKDSFDGKISISKRGMFSHLEVGE